LNDETFLAPAVVQDLGGDFSHKGCRADSSKILLEDQGIARNNAVYGGGSGGILPAHGSMRGKRTTAEKVKRKSTFKVGLCQPLPIW
jgi:hypothetical protein